MADGVLEIHVVIDGKRIKFEIPNNSERETTEEIVREAADRFNKTLSLLRKSYKLDDADEYWRMAALGYAVKAVEYEYIDRGSKVAQRLLETEKQLEEYLDKQMKVADFDEDI